jgi:hypothetical protein
MKSQSKKPIFFCYPEYNPKTDDLLDFPDPIQHLIGFFLVDGEPSKPNRNQRLTESEKFSSSNTAGLTDTILYFKSYL